MEKEGEEDGRGKKMRRRRKKREVHEVIVAEDARK